jgi:CDP-diacylglycerol--glycerol-3-phosphate 3-phosphatidyltransferase
MNEKGKLNLANKLTLFRIICVPIFAVFAALAVHEPTRKLWFGLSLIIFCIASITDCLDGRIARKYNMITDLGKFMDPLADKLLTTTAFLYMLKGGALMTEVVVLLVGREFLVSGVRMLAAGSIQKAVIPANFLGKLKTVLMMFMIIFYYGVMWIVGETPWLIPTVTVMSWVCVASSVISGISYIFFSKDIIKDSH